MDALRKDNFDAGAAIHARQEPPAPPSRPASSGQPISAGPTPPRRGKKSRVILLGLAVIVLSAADYIVWFRHLPLIASAVVAVFAGTVVWLVYRSVMRPQRPVGDRIAGAICVYVLIGLGCASVYETLDGVIPGSFRFPADSAWMTLDPIRYRYFSFVTLATLGYGDVTPVTALAGTLASMEAIGGQLYIGITVARLVALSLADHSGSEKSSRSDA